MPAIYNFTEIEDKWQKIWGGGSSFKYNPLISNSKKYYILEMLPYPSGALHMGHVRNYTAGDVQSRFRRAIGFNVLYAIGWDAFGLPAENAAIERKLHPKNWTLHNIEQMKVQLKKLGFSYDWDRETTTCLPQYYKHEQAIFIKMLENGLAYQKESIVNWDPVDQTVLANEQVVDGKGWRSGAVIERKSMKQWFLKISNYAEELLSGLNNLSSWPEKIKVMQKNWIGKSNGVEISFKLTGNLEDIQQARIAILEELDSGIVDPCKVEELEKVAFELKTIVDNMEIKIFTTRPETLFGATFIAISAGHSISTMLAKTNSQVCEFIKKHLIVQDQDEGKEKFGFNTGLHVHHPLIAGKALPVYIANFVNMDYGTGALFGCPAHDERDSDFAKKYHLEAIDVIDKHGIMINSSEFDGLTIEVAKARMISKLEELGCGKNKTAYRLKDWGISRQRYWGCPIPIVYCDNCGTVPEKLQNLPISLPEDVEITKSGNPLEMHPTWKHCKCPTCEQPAERETDTFDTFWESSWYFLRYADPHNDKEPFNTETINHLLPVDDYIGGIEHAILHLLYARFFTRVLYDLKMVNFKEPFTRLTTQGMVCANAYYITDPCKTIDSELFNGEKKTDLVGYIGAVRPLASLSEEEWTDLMKFVHKKNKNLKREDLIMSLNGVPISSLYFKQKGNFLIPKDVGVCKMSKSKLNGVDPNDAISAFGADSTRLFILSDTPLEGEIVWSNTKLASSFGTINRIWTAVLKSAQQSNNKIDPIKDGRLLTLAYKTAVYCTSFLANFEYNKMIAAIYSLLDGIERSSSSSKATRIATEVLVKILAPLTPHVASELADKICLKTLDWPLLPCHAEICAQNGDKNVAEILSSVIGNTVGEIKSSDKIILPFNGCEGLEFEKDALEIGVQVNGKLRGEISIPSDSSQTEDLYKALALQNQKVLTAINGAPIKKVIVVMGRIVNILI